MLKQFVFIIINLAVYHSAAGSDVVAEKGGVVFVDPDNTDPCGPKPLPNPSNPFVRWDDATLNDEWWSYVMIASNNSAWFNQFPRDEDCEQPWTPAEDPIYGFDPKATLEESRRIRYFWQASCPYTASWLGRFTWTVPRTKFEETCYILWPCCQKIRIVRCTTDRCQTRTHCKPSSNVKIVNSVCCETNFRQHKDVYVFCPITYALENGQWIGLDCRRHPQRCLKLVTISVPQCCECWSCRGFHHIHTAAEAP